MECQWASQLWLKRSRANLLQAFFLVGNRWSIRPGEVLVCYGAGERRLLRQLVNKIVRRSDHGSIRVTQEHQIGIAPQYGGGMIQIGAKNAAISYTVF